MENTVDDLLLGVSGQIKQADLKISTYSLPNSNTDYSYNERETSNLSSNVSTPSMVQKLIKGLERLAPYQFKFIEVQIPDLHREI